MQDAHPSLKHVEICPEAAVICNKIADRLNVALNGCFLISDYGFEDPELEDRDTLRAFYEHKQCHPLNDPGNADLTADVDFSYLTSAVEEKAIVYGPVNQSDFLIQVGIGLRLKVCLETQFWTPELIKNLND